LFRSTVSSQPCEDIIIIIIISEESETECAKGRGRSEIMKATPRKKKEEGGGVIIAMATLGGSTPISRGGQGLGHQNILDNHESF
jgi:hypothetical protein